MTAGQIWKALYDFRVPVDVPTGTYDVAGYFHRRHGASGRGQGHVRHDRYRRSARHFEIPEMDHSAGADFGGKIRLLGYDVDPGSLEPGGEFAVCAPLAGARFDGHQLHDVRAAPR